MLSKKFQRAANSVKEGVMSVKAERKKSLAALAKTASESQLNTAKPICTTVSYDYMEKVLTKPPEERSEREIQPFISWIKARCQVLSRCDPAIIQEILQNCSVERCPENTLLIKSGDRGDKFYIILNGTVTVWVHGSEAVKYFSDENGNKTVKERETLGKTVATLGPGQGFGEVALINADCTRTASVLCEEITTLLCINRDLYDRSIKQFQAREFHEKYSFIFNSAYLTNLPAKSRYLVACALSKESYKFGNRIVDQGKPANDVYFLLSLDQTLEAHEESRKSYQELLAAPPKPKRPVKSAGATKPPAIGIIQQDLCLLSAYDAVGGIEAALNIPVYLNTVTVEEEVICFKLNRSAFVNLVKDRSNRTTAALCKLSMIQNDARISRIKDEISSLERLQDLLRLEFRKLCKGDEQLMRAIEQQVTQNTSQTLGYGHTCYVEDSKTHNPPNSKVKLQGDDESSETVDDIKKDGMKFLNPLICKGSIPPSLVSFLNTTAKRYAVAGHSVMSPRRPANDYIKALANEKTNKRDQVSAWCRGQPVVK